jgi:hypothetical protein
MTRVNVTLSHTEVLTASLTAVSTKSTVRQPDNCLDCHGFARKNSKLRSIHLRRHFVITCPNYQHENYMVYYSYWEQTLHDNMQATLFKIPIIAWNGTFLNVKNEINTN